jgi:hypothetical protein
MTTNNSVNTGLSGTTGSGNFVGSTSATLVTPTLGAATATSVTFSPTTGGNVGTTTNDNASAGVVGEFVSSTIALASAVALSNGAAANVTSISLTAGDWDVTGNVFFNVSTSATLNTCWVSTTSATLPDASLRNTVGASTVGPTGLGTPFLRLSLSGTTTVFLSALSNFGTGTNSGCGGIFARRRR